MKTTKYFDFRRFLSDRHTIRDEWIEDVIQHPVKTVVQEDGRIRKWGRVKEAGNKWLRVVLLEDGLTIHNAFFDRTYKE